MHTTHTTDNATPAPPHCAKRVGNDAMKTKLETAVDYFDRITSALQFAGFAALALAHAAQRCEVSPEELRVAILARRQSER